MDKIQENSSAKKMENNELISMYILQSFPKEASAQIDASTKFADMIIDSLSYIEFIVSVEEKFNIEFDDDMLATDTFTTIGDLILYVEKKVQNGE